MEIMRKVIEGDGEERSENHLQATERDKELGCNQGMARGKKGICG